MPAGPEGGVGPGDAVPGDAVPGDAVPGEVGELRNAAGPVALSLPAVLGAEPVTVSQDDVSVGFTLQGAVGAPSLGLPEGMAERATPAAPAAEEAEEAVEAVEASATYDDALAGVDVVYTATGAGVKEDVVLAGPDSPTSFDFTVETSAGLSAVESPSGDIDFVDDTGEVRANFAPPFAYDANFKGGGGEGSFTEAAVSLRIVETSPTLVVRLAADEAWLDAPERAWPVVLDPVLSISGPAVDTYLSKSNPTSNFAGSNYLQISAGSAARRPMYGNPIATYFDEPVTVVGAQLQLYADVTQLSPTSPVAAHVIDTPGWNSNQATWNNRLTGVAWNSPGGDYRPQPESVNPDVAGAPGWRYWDITGAAQGWLDGEPDLGVVLKHTNEASGAYISFASSNHASSGLRPRIVVQWQPLAGLRSPFAFEEFDLGEAGAASLNVASGNLTIADRDLAIASTGLGATVDRFYQSRIATMGSVGARWRMWPQSEEKLYVLGNGDVTLAGSPEEAVVFSANPNGSYSSPHGYRSTLVKEPDGTFTLTAQGDGTRHAFFATGHLRHITDRNGNAVELSYIIGTDDFWLRSMTDTQGRVTTFSRSGPAQYRVQQMTDPAGRVHGYAYDRADPSANLASYSDPAGKVTTYDYAGPVLGLMSRLTDPLGNATTFAYDSRDRLTGLTRVTNPATGAGPTWSFDYSVPWQTTVTDPNGHPTTHHFDRRGRVNRVVDALGHERQSSYDSNSNVLDRTSALGNQVVSQFDANNNLESSTLPTGAVTTMDYDDAAFKYSATRVTSAEGNITNIDYDPRGNLEKITDAMAGASTLTYNANGTLSSAKDPKNNQTTYGYDGAGNLIRVTPPAPLGATTIAYDALSRPTAVTDGKGQVTTTSYDVMDRVTQVSVAGGPTVTLTYGAGGRVLSRTDATGTTTSTYDRLNRPVSEALPGGRTNTYTYDAVGNLATKSDVAGVMYYYYNAVNLVTQAVDQSYGSITTFAYDDDDNRSATTYPNGVTQTATYDDSGRLTLLEGKLGTNLLSRFAYSYILSGDDTGLRQSVVDRFASTTTYSYDPLDRLTRAHMRAYAGGTVSDHRYTYDAAGNRTSDQVGSASPVPATFNAANQLTARGATTYTYDANGNQTASSAGQALTYNAADQTTSLKRAGGTALPATYAGLSQVERATAGTTGFTHTLLGVSAATTGAATQASVRDPAGGLIGLRTGTSRSYFLFDGLGSVVAVTNGSGVVTNRYDYDPYGVTTETLFAGSVANPWRYAGQYQDVTTGLYKMGARYYQPELGRWTQPDPSGAEANAYLYVGGNPVNFVDPSGLFCVLGTYGGPGGGCRGGSLVDLESLFSCLQGLVTGGIIGAVGTPVGAAVGAVLGCAQNVGITALQRSDVITELEGTYGGLFFDTVKFGINIVKYA